MRMAEPAAAVSPAPVRLSRKCAACEEEERVSRAPLGSPVSGAKGPDAPAIVHDVLRSPGQPLDAVTRAFFEPRFGLDLGHVQIHSDTAAAESARAVGALAYTVGNHVAFGSPGYDPITSGGKSLIAHELVHTLQQASPVCPVIRRQAPGSGAGGGGGAGCAAKSDCPSDFCVPMASVAEAKDDRHRWAGILGGLKWSSQRLKGGGCDEEAQAAFGSVWSGAIDVTRSTVCGRTR